MTARKVLLATVAIIGVSACGSEAPQQQAAKSGGEIRVAIGSDLRSTEPGVNRDAITDDIMNHVVEGLVAYKRDLSVGLALAQSVEPASDGLSYTFKIRPDVQFHNGQPVTAKEVKWSIDRALRPDGEFLCKNWYDGSEGLKIAGVDIVDPMAVRVRLAAPDAMFLTKFANFQCLIGIVHPDSAGPDGKWREPIGTGPYRIADWQKGRYVMLSRFPAYKSAAAEPDGYAGGRAPLADNIRWMVVPDASSARAALLGGQLDLITGVDAADLAELQAQTRFTVHTKEALDWNALLIQTKNPLLADKNLRLAIAHAIDLPTLAKSVTHGISKANPSAVASSSPYFTAVQQQGYRYDPALAGEYLKKSGYRGQVLKITTNRHYQHMFDNALAIQAMLGKAGIKAELDVTDWPAQLNRYFAGDFQMLTTGFSARVDPVLAYRAFLGDKKKDGWAQWESGEAKALVEQATQIAEPPTRQQIFDTLHRQQIADLPILNLYNHYVIQANSPRISGYEAWTTGKVRLWNVQVNGAGGGN